MQIINIFHILLVAPLLYMIGTHQAPAWLTSNVLVLLGLGIILYHALRLYQRGLNWVNLLHVLVVGPFFIHLGMNPTENTYTLATYLAGFVLGFHLWRLLAKTL